MLNTLKVGEISEACFLVALLKAGYNVLKPVSNTLRYDLVIEFNGKFKRVQCKTGRLRNGVITYNAASTILKGENQKTETRGYIGDADLFGVYCPGNGKSYLIPIEEVGTSSGSLRVEPSKNSQKKFIRIASNYEVVPLV